MDAGRKRGHGAGVIDSGFRLEAGSVHLHGRSIVELEGEPALCPGFHPLDLAPAEVAGLGTGVLCPAVTQVDKIDLRREVFRPADRPDRLAVRLVVTNGRPVSVRLTALTPVQAGPGELRLGDTPAGDWVFVRQPRHKNDMPAAVVAGSVTAGIWDAVRGTEETGGWTAVGGEALPRAFVSSELTVLHAPGASLLAGVFPLDQQLVSSRLELEADRRQLRDFRVTCLGDGQLLASGAQVASQWVLLDARTDVTAAVEAYVDILEAIAGPRQRRGAVPPRPTVWCSWYYYADAFTQQEAEANLAALQRRRLPFDVFQIDECWDQGFGAWYPNADWPDLAGLARRCRQAGCVPGIWTCGLLVEPRARLGRHHPEWLLRRRGGGLVRFDMAGMANQVLDPTHPQVQRFLEETYRRLTVEYGFTYHKVDFTRAVVCDPEASFHDPAVNRAQAYRMGIEAVRRGIGPDAYLNICGGLYGPLLGLVDAQRTGSDVQSLWPAAPPDQRDEGYGPFTIKQNALRYWWNRLWDNDPDALMVRRRQQPYRQQSLSLGLMSDAEALTSALNQYLGGGLVCTTENLAEVEDDRLLLLRHCAPSVGAAAVPRDLLAAGRFPAVFDTAVTPRAAGLDPWHTVSLVNWFDEPRTFALRLDAGLVGALARTSAVFWVTSFTTGSTRQVAAGERFAAGPIAPHACEVLKVQSAYPGAPRLLHGDGHFSMGGTEVVGWEAGADGATLTVDWPWPVALGLEVLPAAGRALAGCQPGAPARVQVPPHSRQHRVTLAYA